MIALQRGLSPSPPPHYQSLLHHAASTAPEEGSWTIRCDTAGRQWQRCSAHHATNLVAPRASTSEEGESLVAPHFRPTGRRTAPCQARPRAGRGRRQNYPAAQCTSTLLAPRRWHSSALSKRIWPQTWSNNPQRGLNLGAVGRFPERATLVRIVEPALAVPTGESRLRIRFRWNIVGIDRVASLTNTCVAVKVETAATAVAGNPSGMRPAPASRR